MSVGENIILDNLPIWLSTVQNKSSAGRGTSSKLNLYGIKKLRELILDFAVRGLLVPQDPSDESANVLLEKIAACKEHLQKEGRIKKKKGSSNLDESKKNFEVPNSWEWVRLDSIAEFINGHSFKSSDFNDVGIGVVKIGDIQNGVISAKNMSRVSSKVIEPLNENLKVSKNDMVIAMSGATTGKLGFNYSEETYYLNQRVGKIVIHLCDPKYIYYPLTTKISENLAQSRGMAIPNLSTAQINEIVFALPPLAEQHRIVAKVDELMALCDTLQQQQEDSIQAHERLVESLLEALSTAKDAEAFNNAWELTLGHFDILFTTDQSINKLKDTILQLAVMGKLVSQDPNDEPANVLLEKVAAEKNRLVKEGKIKGIKSIEYAQEDLHLTPKSWSWCSLSNIISIMDSGWSPACLNEPSSSIDVWGVLKTTSVQRMSFLNFENKTLPANKDPKPQFEVKAGDILITRAGPRNRVGISCLVKNTRPKLMISDKLIRFHLIGDLMSKNFISLCLNAGSSAIHIEKSKSGMADSQVNVSQNQLKATPIPIPPLAEQHRIVSKVDELMVLCDELQNSLQDAQETQIQLTESIVKNAL